MKSYKLIKTYPGLGELKEVMQKPNGDYVGYVRNKAVTISKHEIENFPEFWQKVKPREFQIMSFKHIFGNHYTLGHNSENYFLVLDKPYTEQDLLNSKDIYIYSVKRLSDGHIFTVGDKVKTATTRNYQINTFDINPHYPESMMINNMWANLRNVEIIKLPLEITCDGVEIFDEDTEFFYVSADLKPQGIFSSTQSGPRWNFNASKADRSKYLTFSTEQKAREYVFNNKKCLSIEDVMSVFSPYSIDLRKSLTKLVGKLK